MKNRPALKLNTLFMFHNLYLTIISRTFAGSLYRAIVAYDLEAWYLLCYLWLWGWLDPAPHCHLLCKWCWYNMIRNAEWKTDMDLAQLPDQVPWINRHCFPVLQGEALDLPPHLSPQCHRSSVLHPAHWFDRSAMGSDYYEPSGPRCDVLVLFPECSWCPHLGEGMDHLFADLPVCHWPWWVDMVPKILKSVANRKWRLYLLRLLHLLHIHLLPVDAVRGQVRWRGIRCFLRNDYHHLLPRSTSRHITRLLRLVAPVVTLANRLLLTWGTWRSPATSEMKSPWMPAQRPPVAQTLLSPVLVRHKMPFRTMLALLIRPFVPQIAFPALALSRNTELWANGFHSCMMISRSHWTLILLRGYKW